MNDKYTVSSYVSEYAYFAPEELITLADCARRLRVSQSRLYHLLCQLRFVIPEVRDGAGKRYVRISDYETIQSKLRSHRRARRYKRASTSRSSN